MQASAMYRYLLFLISLHQTCGIYLESPPFGGSSFPGVYSRDVATNDINLRISSIQDMIIRIMENIESDKGISVVDLKSKAEDLKELTQSILSETKSDVSDEEVKKLLDEEAADLNVVATLSHWMDINPVKFKAHNLNITLQVLQKLSKLLDSQQGDQ